MAKKTKYNNNDENKKIIKKFYLELLKGYCNKKQKNVFIDYLFKNQLQKNVGSLKFFVLKNMIKISCMG